MSDRFRRGACYVLADVRGVHRGVHLVVPFRLSPRAPLTRGPVVPASVTATDGELLPCAHPGCIRVNGVGRPAAAAHGGEVVPVDRLDVIHAEPEGVKREL